MKIIGLDQSSTACGAAIFINGKLSDYTLIKPKSSKRADEIWVSEEPHLITISMPEEEYGTTLLRITAIVDQLEILFESVKPDVVYFEEIFENGNPKGFRSLSRLQGFIAHLCHKLGIRYVIVEESKWANSIATYGRGVKRAERKADINKRMNDLYGLDIKSDDITDALAIGTYAVSAEKENEYGKDN